MWRELYEVDPEIFRVIYWETKRQEEFLDLIASENHSPTAVLTAIGTSLSNKYAEGYPRRRYYGGCEYVDIAEELARERAKKLFGAEHANVQPHSGTQANMAVYFAVLEPGDRILSMDLASGGHLSHGSPVSFSGRLYEVFHYGVSKKDELIDFDEVRRLAREVRPKVIVAGYSAYPREVPFDKFKEIADEVGAFLLADIAHTAGLVATGFHKSPVPYADFVTGTTHKTLRGPRGGFVLTRKDLAKSVDRAVFPRTQGGPQMHSIAAKAVAFKIAGTEAFKKYQEQVVKNSRALAEALRERGLRLVSGGTDTHLSVVDLRPIGITGKKAEDALEKAGITVNMEAIPFDPEKATVTSGIRLGTPAVTTRGMKEDEMKKIAELLMRVLKDPDDERVRKEVKGEVLELCRAFPVYRDLLNEMLEVSDPSFVDVDPLTNI